MHIRPLLLLRQTIFLIAVCAVWTGASGQNHAKPARAASSVQASEPVTLNFANADIDAVARTMATITGRNVVVDPRVKGQITLSTENPVPPMQAFNQFLAALRLQGYTVVESGGLYKVVPEADAKLQTGVVSVSEGGGKGVAAGGQIVTQIFKLNFENANNLVPVLRPLISPNNTINANPGNNSLVITDYADNLQRIARIIAAMDVAHATDLEVIPLRHAIASELAPLVARLIEGGTPAFGTPGAPAAVQAQADGAFKTTLLAEPRSNALIVRAANPARLAQVRALVAQLDQPAISTSGAASGNIHVVYLKNADAVRLATTLRAALAAEAPAHEGAGAAAPASAASAGAARLRGAGGLGAGGIGAATGLGAAAAGGLGSSAASGVGAPPEAISTGGIIQADPATNSLIITAPEPLFRQIRAVIDKLDGRRAQVLIESLIVEVSANKVAEFGIQWQGVFGRYGGTLGLLGSNSGVAGTNILDMALAAASGDPAALAKARPSAGFNAAIAPRINGKYYLGALANFLENSGSANVLSTPNLLTLDNEEAQIIVGENVPFPTGQYTNTGGNNGSVNPFTTVDRKDVGLMLRVRPQINENGTVKLTLYQEVSNVDKSTLASTYGPSTNKRSIESTVLVDDGNIIVLGGLLEDAYSLGEDKVPVLGDVPVVGNLFRSESRTRQKSNLMIFLRPVVVRDNATSDTLVMDRYEAIRALQQASQPEQRAVLRGVSDAPLLPPLPGAGAPAGVPLPLPPGGMPAAAPPPLQPAPAAQQMPLSGDLPPSP
ncbi:type II secretion system secretin GspD [Comamonas sp. NLF-1-9]|uniref:type II secretion system secretin GspD n=1 Tax=Comamonas sp. NLF-1-9 TaxID=2853163 RepID=UPI001C490150|nr:type II secretion system secretin GspD [Comamonas sp. NLF-1-9]QXL83446.1 type II secretion system secretin GspD [Comamonas sp. NLF-1-9]